MKVLETLMRVGWYFTPRAALRALPGSSRTFGPPRRTARWSEFSKRQAMQWHSVYPEGHDTLAAPFFCNDKKVPFARSYGINWPECGVAEIPEARLLDEHGWLVVEPDTHLEDFTHVSPRWGTPVNRIVKLRPVRRIAGRSLNLSSAFAIHNFYHYIVDGLSRWHLAHRAGYAWPDFDHILLPRFGSPMTRKIEEAMGIPKDRILRIGRREHLQCELLVQPSYPGRAAHTPGWVAEFFREIFPAGSTPARRKLFLNRVGTRTVENGDEVERLLRDEGFEELNPLNAEEVQRALSEASHVVGVHGAALANLIFCREGTRVLELMPSSFARSMLSSYYYTFCASSGLPYGLCVGRSLGRTYFPFNRPTEANFQVDSATMRLALDELLQRKSG